MLHGAPEPQGRCPPALLIAKAARVKEPFLGEKVPLYKDKILIKKCLLRISNRASVNFIQY